MTTPLPPYSGPAVACVKCGAANCWTMYHGWYGACDDACPGGLFVEHLARRCRTCNYRWVEACTKPATGAEPWYPGAHWFAEDGSSLSIQLDGDAPLPTFRIGSPDRGGLYFTPHDLRQLTEMHRYLGQVLARCREREWERNA